MLGGRARTGEVHGGEGKLARWSIGGEEGRGRGLRDGLVLGGSNGVGGGVPGRGERSGSLVWGGMERGGAGTRGGEVKRGEGARQEGELRTGGTGGRRRVAKSSSRSATESSRGTARAGEHT